jgi:hypothetical protein
LDRILDCLCGFDGHATNASSDFQTLGDVVHILLHAMGGRQ